MNLLLLVGSIVITVLVFLWLVRVLKATLKTALLIAVIVFALQFFGIGTDKIFYEVNQILRSIWRLIPGKQEATSLGFATLLYHVKQAVLSLIAG